VLDLPIEDSTVDAIPVPNQPLHIGLGANRFHDLLGGPRRVRVCRDVYVEHAFRRSSKRTANTHNTSNVTPTRPGAPRLLDGHESPQLWIYGEKPPDARTFALAMRLAAALAENRAAQHATGRVFASEGSFS
jgi:hypothetical protein